MARRASIVILALLIAFVGACTKSEKLDPAEQAWSELAETWSELESAEEKTQLAEDYLAKFPDTEHSGLLALRVVYYRGHEMEDPHGAFDAVYSALGRIEDPEQRFVASMSLFDLADSMEVPLNISEVAKGLEAERPLSYDEHQWVFETAVDLEEWKVANQHADAAFELATAEAYRADYPDRDFTEKDITERVQRRKATALAYEGWAAYNLGDTELAFERFADAEAVGSLSYLGVPNTPLYSFWGRAALGEGDFDRAIELLGAETLFGQNAPSTDVYLREAYAAKNGGDEDFDKFLWATRNELATAVDDFSLRDYEGNEISLSEVSTGKVTLLAFWFPT